jgi:hypothetical protein
MTFRPGGNRDLRSIAAVLDVAHVLEGTVRRDGNRVRITTELVDAQTDQTLWSDSSAQIMNRPPSRLTSWFLLGSQKLAGGDYREIRRLPYYHDLVLSSGGQASS